MLDHHFIMLVAALLLLTYSLVKQNSLALVAAVIIIAYETFKLKLSSEDLHFTHLSSDLLLVGLIAGGTHFCKSWFLKTITFILGLAVLFGLHTTVFHSTDGTNEVLNSSQSGQVELLVRFKDKSSYYNWEKTKGHLYETDYPIFHVKDNSFMLDEYASIKVAGGQDIDGVINSLVADKEILDAELNDIITLDPLLSRAVDESEISVSTLNDPDISKQWAAGSLMLEDFHKYMSKYQIKSQSSSIIAILDTGVDAQHEDLVDNYLSISLRSDDDERGHGTHCAGIAAAVTGNKIGIASLLLPNSSVKVTGVQVMNKFGMGTQKMIIDGIIEAADAGCSVISLSLGGPKSDKRDLAYEEAVKYANDKGSIVIASAGNSGGNAREYVPAGTLGVIAVTALDSGMGKASYGNDVSGLAMGLAAPGSDIYSTKPNNTYAVESGTSMAAPYVSGLVGLMKAYDKSLTTDEVYRILKKSARVSDNLIIVNPQKAMELLLK